MKLASIETVKEILPHPNADKLELAKILGWQAVVEKGKFKPGDRVVFVVIDTILPAAPWSAFLQDRNAPEKSIRLRTIKLRGEHSRGLVLPLDVLPENVRGWHEGADVGGTLGVKKYEKEIPAQLSGEALGAFPTYICPTTDEDNGLSNLGLVEEVLKHPKLTLTKKLDGSSCTIIIDAGEISHVCSRRLSLRDDNKNAFWLVAKKLKISNLASCRYIVQGELMGPGIQGNQLKLTEPTLYVYQVQRRAPQENDARYFNYTEMAQFSGELGCFVVPLQGETLSSSDTSLEALQSIADAQTLPCGKPAEGIVVRPSTYAASGNGRPLGFKLINKHYID
jgi:RNA ligase (TIGR02306 family)